MRMSDSQPIRNVSDTALWMAYYRAMESRRPDALFRDPFAGKLAGERGEQAVASLKRGRQTSAPMVVRTAVIDELLQRAIAQGCDVVLNLAAGLDTRPFRLALPPSLQWIEADLPDLMSYKQQHLAAEKPICRFRSVSIDLADRAARQRLLADANAAGTAVVVITEGLLGYLDQEEVIGLARDLHSQPNIAKWITDFASPMVLKRINKQWGKQLNAARAPLKFAPAEGELFFQPHGWCPEEFRDMMLETERLNRPLPGVAIFKIMRRIAPSFAAKQARLWRSGMVLMTKC
jgi:methyltransferase (TIGR00027 family)